MRQAARAPRMIRTTASPGSESPFPPSQALAGALEAWFPRVQRDLPWRRERSGYSALVSEVMLQQTQVSRVVPAFERFVRAFPGPEALADASEESVLAAWQGLGYYRRARLLQRAARAICDRHGGQVPRSAVDLAALPGIGRYTAGAIASIAFGERTPIVDGNVLRVTLRVAGRAGRTGAAVDERWAWQQAEALVGAADDPAILNEALMELGATVCTPRAPRCGECPWASCCKARESGMQESIPAPRVAASRKVIRCVTLVALTAEGVLLEERPASGLWAGMLQPPTLEGSDHVADEELVAQWGIAPAEVDRFTHVTSHRSVEFSVRMAPEGWAPPVRGGWRSVPADRLAELPLSNAAWRALSVLGAGISPPPSAQRIRRGPRARRRGPSDS